MCKDHESTLQAVRDEIVFGRDTTLLKWCDKQIKRRGFLIMGMFGWGC
jgi:hypothetical protein